MGRRRISVWHHLLKSLTNTLLQFVLFIQGLHLCKECCVMGQGGPAVKQSDGFNTGKWLWMECEPVSLFADTESSPTMLQHRAQSLQKQAELSGLHTQPKKRTNTHWHPSPQGCKHSPCVILASRLSHTCRQFYAWRDTVLFRLHFSMIEVCGLPEVSADTWCYAQEFINEWQWETFDSALRLLPCGRGGLGCIHLLVFLSKVCEPQHVEQINDSTK